jgi:hypothetical protein
VVENKRLTNAEDLLTAFIKEFSAGGAAAAVVKWDTRKIFKLWVNSNPPPQV